jgi:oligosaccharyltransferase complex subunit epsilon
MAPKRNAREPTPSTTGTTQTSATSGTSTPLKAAAAPVAVTPSKSSTKPTSANQNAQDIALGIWKNYLDTTPQRTKLIDVFMAFLVVVGALQFVYCVLVGNYVCSKFTGLLNERIRRTVAD